MGIVLVYKSHCDCIEVERCNGGDVLPTDSMNVMRLKLRKYQIVKKARGCPSGFIQSKISWVLQSDQANLQLWPRLAG